MNTTAPAQPHHEELCAKHSAGMPMLLITLAMLAAGIFAFIFGVVLLESDHNAAGGILLTIGILMFLVCPFLFAGLKILKPNEALVLNASSATINGTLKGPGFFFVHSICHSLLTLPQLLLLQPAIGVMEATTERKKRAP